MATGHPTHAPTPAPSPSVGAKLLTQADDDPTAEAAVKPLIATIGHATGPLRWGYDR
jgi:hypothetical protein